jgi:hypothetical protein
MIGRQPREQGRRPRIKSGAGSSRRSRKRARPPQRGGPGLVPRLSLRPNVVAERLAHGAADDFGQIGAQPVQLSLDSVEFAVDLVRTLDRTFAPSSLEMRAGLYATC